MAFLLSRHDSDSKVRICDTESFCRVFEKRRRQRKKLGFKRVRKQHSLYSWTPNIILIFFILINNKKVYLILKIITKFVLLYIPLEGKIILSPKNRENSFLNSTLISI